jgi:hypothetical protein
MTRHPAGLDRPIPFTLTPKDRPIPFTLTPKALALLADPGAEPGEWACTRCANAWFGTPPGDGLCPPCRAGQDGR